MVQFRIAMTKSLRAVTYKVSVWGGSHPLGPLIDGSDENRWQREWSHCGLGGGEREGRNGVGEGGDVNKNAPTPAPQVDSAV